VAISSRVLSALCIASALVAQSPTDVLKLIPESATSVDLTWRMAEANERYLKATAALGEKDGLVNFETLTHMAPGDIAPGTIAQVSFRDPEDSPAKNKARKAADKSAADHPSTWKLTLVPVKNPKELAKRLKAKGASAVQSYQWKLGEAPAQERYLAFRAGYALVSEHKSLVELALKPGPSLEPELAPLAPWLQEHDTVMVITEKSIRQAMEEVIQEAHPPSGAPDSPLPGLFKGLAEKVRSSVPHVALALDLPKDGSLRVTARAFFKAASPLASEGAALPALPGHPLGRLPEGGYALAMGGQWPLSMGFLQTMASQVPGLKGEDREQLTKLLNAVDDQVLRTSFRLRAPQSGEPFVQGMTGVSELKNGKTWLEAMKRQQAWSQAHLGGAFSYQEGVLPELPSLTVNIDLGKLAGDKVPPAQMAMIGGLLFGGSRLQISYAVVDEHTLAYAFGEREALKPLLAELQQRKPLSASKGIQGAEALLPKDGRFLFYLDPRGLQGLVASVLKAFTGKDATMTQVAETLPLTGAIAMDASGIQFTGSARPETLEAFGKVFSELGKGMGGDKTQQANPGPGIGEGTADPEDEDDDA